MVSTDLFERVDLKDSKTSVYEVPVSQEGVQLYIANDGPLQSKKPGKKYHYQNYKYTYVIMLNTNIYSLSLNVFYR